MALMLKNNNKNQEMLYTKWFLKNNMILFFLKIKTMNTKNSLKMRIYGSQGVENVII
jgi:hypothetical protein